MGQGALGLHKRTLERLAPTAEDALNHLLLTSDVEQLYRSAFWASFLPWRSPWGPSAVSQSFRFWPAIRAFISQVEGVMMLRILLFGWKRAVIIEKSSPQQILGDNMTWPQMRPLTVQTRLTFIRAMWHYWSMRREELEAFIRIIDLKPPQRILEHPSHPHPS